MGQMPPPEIGVALGVGVAPVGVAEGVLVGVRVGLSVAVGAGVVGVAVWVGEGVGVDVGRSRKSRIYALPTFPAES